MFEFQVEPVGPLKNFSPQSFSYRLYFHGTKNISLYAHTIRRPGPSGRFRESPFAEIRTGYLETRPSPYSFPTSSKLDSSLERMAILCWFANSIVS